YTNGARGIWFWSGRMWDAEDLFAVNKVVRAIEPIENVIVNGNLVGNWAQVKGPGRVSGMRLHDEMVLLIADYYGHTNGEVKLRLNVPKGGTVTDLLDEGKVIMKLMPGKDNLIVNLNGKRARLLRINPK